MYKIMDMGVFRSIQLLINPDLCQACERCKAVKACRTKAIVQIDPGEPPYLEPDRCRDCWACIKACVNGAIQKINPDA